MNYIHIVGNPTGEFSENHVIKINGIDEVVYETHIISKTASGGHNKIKVLVNDKSKIMNFFRNANHVISVYGDYRSFNKNIDNKRISEMYIKVSEAKRVIRNAKHINKVEMNGEIISEIIEKHTKSGLVIETRLRVKRENNPHKKYDYIQLVAYGDMAKKMLGLEKYDKISITGRVHSRDYEKKISDNEIKKKTAYEVAVYKLKILN